MTHEDYGQETNHSLQAHMMTQFQDFFDRKFKITNWNFQVAVTVSLIKTAINPRKLY